ncbi:MAG: ABC transporter permease [Bacteroidota bacterium]
MNNLKIITRTLWKDRFFAAISIVGLAVSISVVLLIALWLQSEVSMDRFHEKSDQLHHVFMTAELSDKTLTVKETIPYPLAQAIEEQIPEVERVVVRNYPLDRVFSYDGQLHKATGSFASFSIFDAFSFPLLAGTTAGGAAKMNSVVLTEQLAERIFGVNWQSNAIGQSLTFEDETLFEVIAVCANPSDQSTIQFDYILNVQHQLKDNEWLYEWGNTQMFGYIELKPTANIEAVNTKLRTIIATNELERTGVITQSFKDQYLYSQFDDQAKVAGGRIEYIRIFGIAGLFLLLIACINFINLATARANRRRKEVGVRKTIGASRWSLVQQFMSEALFITTLSVGGAVLLAQLGLPYLQELTGKTMQFDYGHPLFWGGIAGVIVATTLLSGTYPSFVLAAFRPSQTIKDATKSSGQFFDLRKGLVILQFGISSLLIIGAIVVQQQIEYIKTMDIGLDKDNIVYIYKDNLIGDNYSTLKNELAQTIGITDVTITGGSPIKVDASTSGVEWTGKQTDESNVSFALQWVDYNYADIFGIEMVDGRFYEPGRQVDSLSLVINEEAARIMNLAHPVGAEVTFWDEKRRIIGVMEDFHTRSLHEPLSPMVVLLDAETTWSMFVRVEPEQTATALAGIKSVFQEVIPTYELEYSFLDENYQQQYQSEFVVGSLANLFAFIAMLVSCLGLLGLAAFMTQQRTKEIGIRKVLGASVTGIVALLSKDFIRLVLIAFLLTIPVAYYFVQNWLDDFTYHIDLKWWLFAIAGLVAIGVALFTVSVQSVRAALANPVKSLRSE